MTEPDDEDEPIPPCADCGAIGTEIMLIHEPYCPTAQAAWVDYERRLPSRLRPRAAQT